MTVIAGAPVQKRFPIDNDVVCYSVLIDFNKHLEVSWDNVEFFVDTDKLYDEFTEYQTLSNNEILNTAFDDAKVVDDAEDVLLLNGYFVVAS